VGRAIAAAGMFAVVGCLDVGAFTCMDDGQCDVAQGICVEGFCAVPDPDCPHDYRYVERAPESLAGRCTGPLRNDTTSTSEVSSSTTEATTLPDSTSTSSGDSTTGPSLDTTTTSGPPESTGMMCEGNRCACAAGLGVGYRHTCAIRFDDAAVCWGWNAFEQITIDREYGEEVSWPTEIGLTPSLVVPSERHTCAIDDGAVWCLGRNEERQSAPMTEALVVAPTSDNGVVAPTALSTGLDFTCALANAADVTCWGENQRHQLGTDVVTAVLHTTTLPVTPLGLIAGSNHACVWTDEQVWCWGDNRAAQLGVDPLLGAPRFAVPQLVAEATSIVGVSAGTDHTCAAVEGGSEVWCVGGSDAGQLGAVLKTPSATPIAVQGLPDDALVVELHARLDNNCALFDDGEIWCWGGMQGDFLLGTEMNAEPLVPPQRVEARADFATETIVRMGLGSQHICALTDESRVWCWGSDNAEQLGGVDPGPGLRAVELDLDCPL
jgi:alpha-tubulin suppressor-like RCC1 family protein